MQKEELELELLLLAVYRLSGFDFRQYMNSSIMRRVQNRLRLEQLPGISRLTERVIEDDTVLKKLLDDFSINVTEMFRDPSFFASFRRNVVPHLKGLPQIRIWHAGCSTGEEAYSMAILLEEEGLGGKAKIYATDMSEKVIRAAEKGVIPLSKMQDYTKNYLQAGGRRSFSEYYTADSHFATLDPSLREKIIFAQHNLVTDGSFNEFHVVICRNVLIYFNQDLQNHVLRLINASLSQGGFLGLGSKEAIRSEAHPQFTEFDASEKIYRKMQR
ncbi:protein-glutamate O-methyltransferase CheR [Neobacillus piezotolerans]|uniref:Protein-glutamate O-methyltransferase CheR n=1 Tax=Neobacillus piezotolerans TaxID=2259171 RepID=A0A3D8GT65_9BACI|nr:protein-glutamate O-methyltransferase CheR [Neobacillus piezotolerans]RDU37638.1 protein-glutamate O-methyltransferase CheR [Neobacillus piezotolerans]